MLISADFGSTIRVHETATNCYGTSQPASSAATAAEQGAVTPTVSISGPRSTAAGKRTEFTAAVSDTQGTPTGYRWMLAGKLVGTGATLTETFTAIGSQTLAVQVTDSVLTLEHAPVGASIVVA